MPESARPEGSIKKEDFFSPAPGDLAKSKKQELAKVYAAVRKTQGGSEAKEDKTKAAKIAWSQVKDEDNDWKVVIAIWNGFKICLVDGEYVRKNIDANFTEGTNPMVNKIMPADELWIEWQGEGDEAKEEMLHTLVHEPFEYFLMKFLGLKYDPSHDLCIAFENIMYKFENDSMSKEDIISQLSEILEVKNAAP